MNASLPTGWILSSNPGYNAELYQKSADKLGHQLQRIHPNKLSLLISAEEPTLWLDDKPITPPDYLIHEFDPLTHQHCMHLCRYTQSQGTRLLYEPEGIDHIYDKSTTHRLLQQAKLPTPRTLITQMPCRSELVATTVGFPCLIKKTTASFGDHIFRCQDSEQFKEINAWIASSPSSDDYIIQAFLQTHAGMDFRFLVLNGQLLATTQRTATQGYKTNAHQGGHYQAISAQPDLVNLAIQAQQLSGLSLAGVDIMLDDQGQASIIEINHDPYLKIMQDPEKLATDILQFLTTGNSL